jgi:hypothetical protein
MTLTRRRVVAARSIAVIADAVQLGLLPLFSPGIFSVANNVLDVVVAATMVKLVGWHWSFVPAFVAELVPMFDLVPTWTGAVLLATRGEIATDVSAGPPPARLP